MFDLNINNCYNVAHYRYNFRYSIHPMRLSYKDMKIITVLEVRLFRNTFVWGTKETFTERTWKSIRAIICFLA